MPHSQRKGSRFVSFEVASVRASLWGLIEPAVQPILELISCDHSVTTYPKNGVSLRGILYRRFFLNSIEDMKVVEGLYCRSTSFHVLPIRAHFDCDLCHHDRRLGWWLWKVWRWLWAWLQLSARRWIWIPGLLSSLSSLSSPGSPLTAAASRGNRRPMMRCGKKSSAGDPNCLMSLMSVKGWSPLSPPATLVFPSCFSPLSNSATPKKIKIVTS